jgi:chromosome segregation ATPase
MSDTPRTEAIEDQYFENSICGDEIFVHARKLERELAAAQAEIVRLKGEAESWEKVFDRTCEHLAEAKEELNDKRKFCYAVEQALDGMKGDYVEIIKELRKDAERYRWLRSQTMQDGGYWVAHGYLRIGLSQWSGAPLDDAIDAAMKEGGK